MFPFHLSIFQAQLVTSYISQNAESTGLSASCTVHLSEERKSNLKQTLSFFPAWIGTWTSHRRHKRLNIHFWPFKYIFCTDWHVNWRWQCESEGTECHRRFFQWIQQLQSVTKTTMLSPMEGVWRTVVMLDSSAKTPAWNFINLHLSFYALAPTETPGLAQGSHGMAMVNQDPAEIWGRVIDRETDNLLLLK